MAGNMTGTFGATCLIGSDKSLTWKWASCPGHWTTKTKDTKQTASITGGGKGTKGGKGPMGGKSGQGGGDRFGSGGFPEL